MLFKLLSTIYYLYKKFTTYPDYYIISEELEYGIEHDIKYNIEDTFWLEESGDWEGDMDEFYVNVTGKKFRHTTVPQNVTYTILRVRYVYNGKEYTAISNNINFKPGENDEEGMNFSIPLSSVWLADHNDKPVRDITEKVKRYIGPRNDFHREKVSLYHFLYYDVETLKDRYPKIILRNALGIKKSISTLDHFTTDLRIL